MRYFVDKKTLNLIVFGITIIFFIVLIFEYFNLRENFYKEYLKHKEIMFILSNYKTKAKAEINEEYIKNILQNNGAEFKSFSQAINGFEIKGRNLNGGRIPLLIYSIENAGIEVVKFKAVDNTGSGIYDFEIILR